MSVQLAIGNDGFLNVDVEQDPERMETQSPANSAGR
jgi:hypothetical protein